MRKFLITLLMVVGFLQAQTPIIRLMQSRDNFEDKLEQNEDLAKLRAGVSLAKSGVQQAQVMVEDN